MNTKLYAYLRQALLTLLQFGQHLLLLLLQRLELRLLLFGDGLIFERTSISFFDCMRYKVHFVLNISESTALMMMMMMMIDLKSQRLVGIYSYEARAELVFQAKLMFQ